MGVESLKATDITKNISQLKGAYPQGTARKALAQILKDFVAATGADLNSVDVIDLNGNKMSILKYVKQADNSNDLSMVFPLQKACKNPEILAKNVLPQVQQYISDQKWHSGAAPVRINLDLRIVQAKQKTGSNIAVGQGPVNLQDINNSNEKVSEPGNASIVEKDNGFKLVYSEKWLLKVLMDDLGYKNKV